MTFRMTNSKDGRPRLNFTVPVRVTLNYLAIYLVANYTTPTQVTSKAKAIEFARDAVLTYGTEVPHYRVGDDNLDDEVEAMETKLTALWA